MTRILGSVLLMLGVWLNFSVGLLCVFSTGLGFAGRVADTSFRENIIVGIISLLIAMAAGLNVVALLRKPGRVSLALGLAACALLLVLATVASTQARPRTIWPLLVAVLPGALAMFSLGLIWLKHACGIGLIPRQDTHRPSEKIR
jgi:hypothetical protein